MKRIRVPLLVLSLIALRIAPTHPESGDSSLARSIMTVWTDREGLPSDTVLDVVQDKAGYIWLASYDGLARFDGDKFTLLGDADGFDGKNARVLELANDGTLWIGTNTAGLYSYRNGAFTHYGTEEGLPDLSVRSLLVDADGVIWAGTANGVSRKIGERFASAVPEGSPPFGIANFLLALHDGSVIVGSNMNGLWLLSSRGVEPYLPKLGLSRWSFSSAYLERSGQLWFGTSSGQILRITGNEIKETYAPEVLNGSSINTFYRDGDGNLWIGTDRGMLMRGTEGYEYFTDEDGLPSNIVSAVCRDTEGNLWVGTERGGLAKFSQGKFVNLTKRDGLLGDSVNAVIEDRFGSLWVAGDDGVSFFPSRDDPYGKPDGKLGGFPSAQGTPSGDGTLRKRSVDAVIEKLRGIRVRQIRAERDGSLAFATYSDNGLLTLALDGSTSSVNKSSGLPINRVRFSYRMSTGALWIGTTAGPVLVEKGTATAFGIERGLPNLFILCAMEDAAGNVWLGTDGGGVSVYDGSSFRTWTKNDGLAGNVVFRVFRDSADRLWICTADGLSLYADGAFYPVNRCLGLGGLSVYETLEDQSGRLWIITGRDVIVADADSLAKLARSAGTESATGPETSAVAPLVDARLIDARTFNRLDGIAGQPMANAWAFLNDSGIVHIPTLKGVSTYNPQSVALNTLPPPVIVEKVVIDGTAVDMGQNPVVVEATADRVTFHYTALSYVVPQRVQFSYLLEGYDREWKSALTSREIAYTNLPPGNYAFRVKAENNDGVVNEEGASVSLRKKPFFWQTVPFFVAIAMLLVMTGFLIAYIRMYRLKKRERELNRLVHERTRELAEERDKSEGLLRNILPPAIAEELKNTGKATPCVYENAAVLFADIVGFTPWSEKLGPDEVIWELNGIFTAFDEIMARHNCERIKTLGDGYLACCGLPVGDPDCAKNMVHAGIDMLKYLEERNRGAHDKIEIRVGVDTGAIVGGVVGVKKYIFDVFGDPVNTAFRLEALSVPMSMTVSVAMASRIRGEFRLLERPSRAVKGKGFLTSHYVVYREGLGEPLDNGSALQAYARARKLFDDGSTDECRALVEKLDYTSLEPEVGFDAFMLLAKIAERSNDEARAREYQARAARFRM
jgi:ligand-binding sensor domain-containing protein/class 3 adenylate cyclase